MRKAARSWLEAPTAILNLRGMNENSGCSVTCWRTTSAQTRGSSISSGAKLGHRVRKLFELDPMELDVLAGGEMTIAAVIFARHMRELAQLSGRQRAVR